MRDASTPLQFAAIICLGVGLLPAGSATGQHDAVFETRTVVRSLDGCTPDAPEPEPSCTYARFRYPHVGGLGGEALDAINASIRARLHADFFDGDPAESLDALGDALLAEYAAFRREFPDLEATWALDRTVEVVYANDRILSLRSDEYSYLGGAHPNSARMQWVVDLASGNTLELEDLLIEGYQSELRRLGEIAFRAARGLAPTESLEEAFWFEGNRFALNDNWTVVDSGLAFRFDAYEVSSYALGPTDFVITRAALATLVRPDGPLAAR